MFSTIHLSTNIKSYVGFNNHVKINKAYRMLGLIKRNFKYLTSESFTLLYKNNGQASIRLLQLSKSKGKGTWIYIAS